MNFPFYEISLIDRDSLAKLFTANSISAVIDFLVRENNQRICSNSNHFLSQQSSPFYFSRIDNEMQPEKARFLIVSDRLELESETAEQRNKSFQQHKTDS
jgi:hypothetical protein